jgi:hypothetical protein
MPPMRVVYLLAVPLLFLCSRAGACAIPALPSIPEKADDVAGVMLDVRRYSEAIVAYTACLREELENAGGDAAPALVRSILIARNNHAVDEHKAVTELYAKRVGPLANLRLAEYLDGESRDCLFGDSVVRTGVVSDAAVLFFVRGNQAYLNLLPATCQNLEREGSFFVGNQSATGASVSPAARGVINPGFGGARGIDTPLSNRVCDQDDIFPYREGSARRVFSCPLGRFYAVSEDEALQILATSPRPPAGETAAGESP